MNVDDLASSDLFFPLALLSSSPTTPIIAIAARPRRGICVTLAYACIGDAFVQESGARHTHKQPLVLLTLNNNAETNCMQYIHEDCIKIYKRIRTILMVSFTVRSNNRQRSGHTGIKVEGGCVCECRWLYC